MTLFCFLKSLCPSPFINPDKPDLNIWFVACCHLWHLSHAWKKRYGGIKLRHKTNVGKKSSCFDDNKSAVTLVVSPCDNIKTWQNKMKENDVGPRTNSYRTDTRFLPINQLEWPSQIFKQYSLNKNGIKNDTNWEILTVQAETIGTLVSISGNGNNSWLNWTDSTQWFQLSVITKTT